LKYKLLVGITGSINAVNSPMYLNSLKNHLGEEWFIEIVLTENAKRFVSELSLSSMCGKVHTEMFYDSSHSGIRIPHVNILENVNAFLILPTSANFLSKIAHGMADDLLSCCILNYSNKLFVAPSMNEVMWQQPVVQSNIAKIKQLGHFIICESAVGVKASTGKLETSGACLPQPKDLAKLINQNTELAGEVIR
jgi:phosphopantothenoylcysteine synthetase/decarboxylase